MSTQTSKVLSFVLRHKPEQFGLEMDKQGWVEVQPLVNALQINIPSLVGIVKSDSKGRYQFSADGLKIRATQGHSVDVNLDERLIVAAEKTVYHGTAKRFLDSILKNGLTPGTRKHVHMTYDLEQAKQTGGRHGSPVVLEVDIKTALEDGHIFQESDNGYILSKLVPPKYLKVLM